MKQFVTFVTIWKYLWSIALSAGFVKFWGIQREKEKLFPGFSLRGGEKDGTMAAMCK
ncbi:MAG: hypothetical protein V8S83_08215 [Oscillospiraceae bacterium]